MDKDNDYMASDDSDDGRGIDSSDDDELVMQEFDKQSAIKGGGGEGPSGSKRVINEFEDEMRVELERRAKAHMVDQDFTLPKELSSQKEERKYFDTDSEEEDDDEDPAARAQANADLFYDPTMDDKDEAWVEKQRNKYREPPGRKRNKPVPTSDAVLNCPACFTTLCHDCQRHETYKTQYRAMFTFNCKVDRSQVMKAPQPKNQKKKKGDSGESQQEETLAGASGALTEETYHPVRCSACDTHVAMFDRDEVYHFFNVVTSH